MLDGTMTRRRLLGHARWLAGVLAWPALRGGDVPAAASLNEASAAGLRPGPDVYGAIGVRPLINARGTFTIISGSTMLPEVRAAMDAASRALRPPRRAGRGDWRAAGHPDPGRMGPGHVGMFGRR